MAAENPSLFARAISEHLRLKERNARLDGHMPIERYRSDEPFENHPLFKSEHQARGEEPRWSPLAPPGGEEPGGKRPGVDEGSAFWLADQPPEFDWGD